VPDLGRLAERGFSAEDARDAKVQAARIEAARAEAAKAMKAKIQASFFAGNPSATAEGFIRLWPQLKDQALLEGAQRDPLQAEVEILRRQFADELL